jgi:hypothetical protein
MAIESLIIPALAPALGGLVSDVFAEGGGKADPGFFPDPSVKKMALDLEAADPSFWGPPDTDWQRDAVAFGVGAVLGLLFASRMG